MEKNTVCLMNDSFPPTIDGVANVTVNYARIIEEKYGSAIVLTPNYPNVTDEYPFEVIRYPSIDTTKLVGYRAGMPVAPVELTKLRTRDVSLIHSHCPMISTVLARTLRAAIDVPVVFTYHTKYDVDIRNAVDSKIIQSAVIKTMVSNISACDAVWTVSRGAGENLRSLGYEGNITIMENGVDLPKGRVSETRIAALRKELGLSPETTVFLFVGRLMWYKGLRLIIDALAKVSATSSAKFAMVFVGDGIEGEEIREYAKRKVSADKVFFTGALSDREKLRDYFCMANLFLFPSTFDTNGIVVREAASCALPSVLIAGSCASEGITDNRNGLMIHDGSVDDMYYKMLYAIGSPEKIRDIGVKAQEEIYLSWEESVARAWEQYDIVLEEYLTKPPAIRKLLEEDFSVMVANVNGLRNKLTERAAEISRALRAGIDDSDD